MSWIEPAEAETLALVLEQTLELNRRGKIRIRHVSFYSSELKNAAQIQDCVKSIVATGHLPGEDERTFARYFNALNNLGVVSGSSTTPALTPLGKTLYDSIHDIDPTDRTSLTQTADGTILRGLLAALLAGADAAERSQEELRSILYNAQLFVEGIPTDTLQSVLDDPDLLFFLQCIHSAGYEVRRFFRLPPDLRTSVRGVWNKLRATDLPTEEDEPTDVAGKTAFAYLTPVVKKSIQSDARYRVNAFLTTYLAERARLADGFPLIAADLSLSVVRAGLPTPGARRHARQPPAQPGPPTTLPRQRLITGCPGSGKSRRARSDAESIPNSVVYRTTFHSDTSYFDFVGNYKPVPIYEASATPTTEVDGSAGRNVRPWIDYRFVPGVFARALVDALANPQYTIILVVEELNRANASAVFGDLLQLLDRGSNGVSEYPLEPPPDLAAFLAGAGLDARTLVLPANLFIWATMNTADQGVFPLDSAFRRRWRFEYLGYTEPCAYGATAQVKYGGSALSWDDFRAKVNALLVQNGVLEDKLVGPYFLTDAEVNDPVTVAHKLFLYLWDDALRFSHDKLSDAGSFSDLVRIYDNGNGSPLKIGP